MAEATGKVNQAVEADLDSKFVGQLVYRSPRPFLLVELPPYFRLLSCPVTFALTCTLIRARPF